MVFLNFYMLLMADNDWLFGILIQNESSNNVKVSGKFYKPDCWNYFRTLNSKHLASFNLFFRQSHKLASTLFEFWSGCLGEGGFISIWHWWCRRCLTGGNRACETHVVSTGCLCTQSEWTKLNTKPQCCFCILSSRAIRAPLIDGGVIFLQGGFQIILQAICLKSHPH